MSSFSDQKLQYFAAFLVSIFTLTIGFKVSWPSPILPQLTNPDIDSPIGIKLDLNVKVFYILDVIVFYITSQTQSSLVSSIAVLGVLCGNLFVGQLQDLFGRRGLLLLATIPSVAGWLMTAFASSYEELLVARFIIGLSIVVPNITSAVYIGEMSSPSIRGKLGMFNLCMVEMGSVIVTAVGSYTSYFVTAIVCASCPVVFFVLFYWMPESPYFYLRKGNIERARECLKRLRVNYDVEKELLEIQACVEKEMGEKSSIWELFNTAKYRKAVFIGLGLKTLQNMSGTIAINAYNKSIFEEVAGGSGLDSSQSAIISTGIAVPAVLIGSVMIDKLGRKPLYYMSTIGCAVALLFEFVYFLMKDSLHSDVSDIGWLPFSGIFLFNIFRSFGINTIPIIFISEIFPANVKAVGLNVILVYNSLLAFLVLFGFPLVEDAVGIYVCFGIFSLFCLLGLCFVIFFIPETKGKSLGDIQHTIEEAVKSNK